MRLNPIDDLLGESTPKAAKLNPIDDLLEGYKPTPKQAPISYWDEVVKPTLVETGQQLFELPKSVGEVFLSGGLGALGWGVGSVLGIAESLKPGATREDVRLVQEDAASRLAYQPRTKPAQIFMEKVGRGMEALTGPAKEAAALAGESWDSPFVEAVARFAGEMATFEALGKAGKVKPKAPDWYRMMTNKERAVVEGMKVDIANGQFTPAEIRELWKDPMNRAELLKRYQAVGKEPLREAPEFELVGKPKGPDVINARFTSRDATPRKLGAEKNILDEIAAKEQNLLTEDAPVPVPGEKFMQQTIVEPPMREIVKPGPSSKAKKGPEGIIGRINQLGGLNVYDDYNAPEMKQLPDMARVMKKSGLKPDELATSLNDEGYVTPTGEPFTGDSLIEYLKSGQGRDILTPDKAESIIERKLRRQENEWINQQLAELEEETRLDASSGENKGYIEKVSLDEVAAEASLTEEELLAAQKDVVDFFDHVSKPTPKGDVQPDLAPELSAAKTFDLANQETEIGTLQSKKDMTPTQGMFDQPKEEMMTLYRAEGKPGKPLPQWIKDAKKETGIEDAQGRWWTDNKEALQWYIDDAGGSENAIIKTLQVPRSEVEKYRVSNLPENHKAKRFSRDAKNEIFLPRETIIGSERGSTGPVNESEILNAILKARGKIEYAMPHLEALGRSVYESGKTRFLDWQAAIKNKLGDLWESFKAHLKAIFERLQSGKVGPLQSDRGSFSTEIKGVFDDAKRTADEYLGAVSTRLGNIDPSLKANLRKFEFSRGMRAAGYTKRVLPFLTKTGTMPKADRAAFDLARKNGDGQTLKAMVTKYGMGKEYHELRNVLAEMHTEAVKVGYDVGFIGNYHPRVLKDTKGFLEYFYKRGDWPVIQKAIREQEVKLQRYLSDDEKAKLINNMLRGYPSGQISLGKPGQLKAREIKTVTPDLNQFYMDSDGALLRYINDVSDAIEARRLFGKGPKGGKVGNMADTIGGYTLDLLQQGKIKPEQERTLRDILDARFNEVGTRGIFGLYKNLSYIDTMGSPISAITQIGDLAWALYKNGISRTIQATARAIPGKSLLKKEDIGIERIASEFADSSKLAKAVDKTFRVIGLTKIDNIGKESLINSTYNMARAKTMNPAKEAQLRKELEPIFEKETDQLIKDLKAGNITENVKLYLFNVLSDFQPISLSEMPQKYLTGGNGRIFYMLKTFTLKQFDMFRREAFQKIGNPGTRTEGIKNLLWLSAAFIAANAGADVIKDLLLGRPINLEDKVVDNLLRLAGVSKFVTWKAREEGVGSAMVRQIAPPFKAVDSISKDITRAGDEKGLEITQSIPVVGKLYYWWFGKGAEKSQKQGQGKLKTLKSFK